MSKLLMNLTRTNGPSVEPISLSEAKSHIRIDVADDDDFIINLIKAAREYAERYTGRAFITQTWVCRLDDFPGDSAEVIRLPYSPLSGVTSIVYADGNNVSQTWTNDSDGYQIDIYSEPGRILPSYGITYPVTYGEMNDVVITYTAGYGVAANDVPDDIKQAMYLMIGHWYNTREEEVFTPVGSRELIGSIKRSVDSLLWGNRVVWF